MDYTKEVSNGINSMPEQNIPFSQKTKEWGIKNLLAIRAMSNTTDDTGRSSRENKEINYDLVNSIFRESDFESTLNPYGIKMEKFGGVATKMQNYNIIRSRLETLRGEEMSTALNFFVYAIAGDAVSAKKQKRIDMVKELLKARVGMEFQLKEQIESLTEQMQTLQENIKTAQDQAQMQQMQASMQELQNQRNNLPDIQAEMKAFNSKYVDPTEQTNNKILKFLKKQDNLALKFNQGWFHGLVSSEEVYYTGISHGHPSVRVVNPLQLDYDKGSNTTFIQDGNWVKEEYWSPIGEIIREYGDVLTKEEIKKIESGQEGHIFMQDGMYQSFAYSYSGGQKRTATYNGKPSHVYVMKVAWRSSMQVGILTYKDVRTGQMNTVEVDDTFVMPSELKKLGATLEWTTDSDIWEGTMIGSDIFINIRPKSNQTKNLPYIGYVYNNVNSIATSLVDLVRPHQYTYIIVWWRLEQELAKAKGRKFIMDIAQLPSSMGWDVDKWMYYFENLGVIWINSKEEGRKGDPSSVATFNQFNAIDMTLSQVVGQYMSVLNKLEELVENIIGVSPQRMGSIASEETATGAQTAIARSTNVTKPLFYFHDLCKEAVLTELLELAKLAYIDGAEMELILDDFEIASLVVDGDKLNGSQMGVFVTNSFEDRKNKDTMEQLLNAAVQQGKASLTDVANVISKDSMSAIRSSLEAAQTRAEEAASQQAQSLADQAQASIDAENKNRELDRAQELEIENAKIQKDILIKKMDVAAKVQPSNDSDIQMASTFTKLSMEGEKLNLDKLKEENRAIESSRSLDIKEKELGIKKEAINSKKSNK